LVSGQGIEHFSDLLAGLGVAPIGGDVKQRQQHEGSFMQAGMGDGQAGRIDQSAAMGKQVKVQGARAILCGSHSTKFRLDTVKQS
jgi:hypothetical protein